MLGGQLLHPLNYWFKICSTGLFNQKKELIFNRSGVYAKLVKNAITLNPLNIAKTPKLSSHDLDTIYPRYGLQNVFPSCVKEE